jgi:hypothetical protein
MLQEDGSADTVLDPQNYLMSCKKPQNEDPPVQENNKSATIFANDGLVTTDRLQSHILSESNCGENTVCAQLYNGRDAEKSRYLPAWP